ncbi:MAG TPA: peptidoglycan bridge formation glycyltransferase FemA/FemB family protein [Spirochaetia bacterium]|nr:peptidoglycan bridge formation glycyltransferase FemA/FemB family protein [Spirochaetia bacterium]
MQLKLESLPLESLDGGDNLLQSGFWGAHKGRFGWTPHAFAVSTADTDDEVRILVLTRTIAAGRSLAYLPHGPDSRSGRAADGSAAPHRIDANLLRALAAEIGRTLKVDLVRYDLPEPVITGENAPEKQLFGEQLSGLRQSVVDVQPASTVIVDIGATEQNILAAMKPKTRYNVLLAGRKGVEVVQSNVDELATWYTLYRETAARDRIAIHSFEYYRALFDLAETFDGPAPDVRLYMARHGGDNLAGIITARVGAVATYLYGASSNEKRNLMPAYALQWRAMRDASAAGAVSYDLFGIPPTDDPEHSMAGLYRFKTGFGGRILHRPGCWDVPIRPLAYAVYRAAESARSYYFHRFLKRTRR